MNEQFDPYYTWLGIPPGEQPPHHYRLLGLQLYEANAKVIDNAADRQMLHLRSFQNGKQSAESQRLLNEVAAARICLQDPARKVAYDGELRRKAAPPLRPPIVAPVEHRPAIPSVVQPAHSAGTKRPRPSPTRNATLEIIKIALGGIAGLAVAVLVIQYLTGVDLVGWSAKAKKDGAQSQKSTSGVSGQKPVAETGRTNPNSVPVSPTPVMPVSPTPSASKPIVPLISQTASDPRGSALPAPSLGKTNQSIAYVFNGPELPANATVIRQHNGVHADGLVTVEQVAAQVNGLWTINDKEIIVTSLDLDENTAIQLSGSAEYIRKIQVKARSILPTNSSVRILCGNVYVILNWEVENENHLLIGGRRTATSSPRCLTANTLHDIVVEQYASFVNVLVDNRLVLSAKGGRLAGNVQIATSHKGSIGIKSVAITPEAKSSFSGGDPPPSEPIDILKDAKPKLWAGAELKDGKLFTTVRKNALALMVFDHVLTGDYILEMGVTRTSGVDGILVGVVVDGHPGTVSLDCFIEEGRGGLSGLEIIDGMRIIDPKHPAVFRGMALKTGERSKIQIAVRKGRVAVRVDEKALFDWQGDASKLSRNLFTLVEGGNRVVVGTWNSTFTIDSLQIHPLGESRSSPPNLNPNNSGNPESLTESSLEGMPSEGPPPRGGLGVPGGKNVPEANAGKKSTATEAEFAALIEALKNGKSPGQRAAAAEKLGKLGKESAVAAVPHLAKSLTDASSLVREKCIFALGTIGPDAKTAIPDLAKQIESESVEDNRGNILRAIVLIDPKAKELQRLLTKFLIGGPWLKPRLTDDREIIENRIFVCETVAFMGPDAQWALPHLKEILNLYAPHLDNSKMVQLFCSAANAIGKIGKKDSSTLAALKNYRDGKGIRMKSPKAETLGKVREACDTALRELESVSSN